MLPTIVYGAQTWTTTKNIEEKMSVASYSMIRSMMNIRRRDKVMDIENKIIKCREFIHEIRKRK